jgi:hypothetical protein
MDNTPPTSSLVSTACGVDGGWNDDGVDDRQRGQGGMMRGRGDGTRGWDMKHHQRRHHHQHCHRHVTTHRPPPASRATAHGVDGGWNNDGEGIRFLASGGCSSRVGSCMSIGVADGNSCFGCRHVRLLVRLCRDHHHRRTRRSEQWHGIIRCCDGIRSNGNS